MESNQRGGEPPTGPALAERIQAVLDELRAGLRLDGGDILFLEVSPDGVLRVRLTGHHTCCPMASATLHAALQHALRQRIPEVKELVCVK
jgi:Fe-S cluster biogenesis protein NfuA